MFDKKEITNPSILLLLTVDRLINDIKRGNIDLDYEGTKIKIIDLFNELYESNKMEYGSHISFSYGFKKFEYCEDIYKMVIDLNKKYISKKEKSELSNFWISLKSNPQNNGFL